MSTLRLDGVLPPLTTPFTQRGDVDEGALVANLERYNSTGLRGYVVFGSNGEAVHLSSAERRAILPLVRRHAADGHLVVAGVNALSTSAAQRALDEAAQDGADVALVITPYFYKGAMDQDVLYRFFADLAEVSPLPLLAYNVPKNTGVVLAPETVARLADHERIIGCKDSSGNLGALASTVRQCPDDFQVLVGNAGIFYSALTMGAVGAILAVACVAPRPSVDVYDAVRRGDHDGAQALQHRLAPLGTMVTAGLGIPGLKAALDLAGWDGGWPRRPLLPLDAAARQELRRAMEVSGFYAALESD